MTSNHANKATEDHHVDPSRAEDFLYRQFRRRLKGSRSSQMKGAAVRVNGMYDLR